MKVSADTDIVSYARSIAGEINIDARLEPLSGDWYRFEMTGERMLQVTAGSERGVLYAVHEVLTGAARGSRNPAFAIRGLNPCETLARHTPEQIERLIDRMGRWRMNTLIVHSNYGYRLHRETIERECAKRGIAIVHYTYANLAFMRAMPSRYFAKSADGRLICPRLECETRLCASDPKGLRLYAKGVNQYLAEHPDYLRLLFATADGNDRCRCRECAAKNPIAQWQAIFDPFFDRAQGRWREMLVYVQRFSVPDELSRIRQLNRVLFDTHLRYARAPLGIAHVCCKGNPRESEVDPRATDAPINVYLLDRLREWRQAFDGELYVFENLMRQGTWSCPRPNTSIYLHDIQMFQRERIDGVVYECFEPGLEAFLPIFDRIAAALWNPELSYTPGPFEQAYLADGATDPVWEHLLPGHPRWRKFDLEYPRMELARRIYVTQVQPSEQSYRDLLQYLQQSPRDSVDWLLIATQALKGARKHMDIRPSNDMEKLLLTTPKLWDVMESIEDPRCTIEEMLERMLKRIAE